MNNGLAVFITNLCPLVEDRSPTPVIGFFRLR